MTVIVEPDARPERPRLLDDRTVWLVARGQARAKFMPSRAAAEHQRVGDIVAIADEGQRKPRKRRRIFPSR